MRNKEYRISVAKCRPTLKYTDHRPTISMENPAGIFLEEVEALVWRESGGGDTLEGVYRGYIGAHTGPFKGVYRGYMGV